MKINLQNTIITGENDMVYVASYNDKTMNKALNVSRSRYTEEKLPCSSEVYAKDTNALYVVNKHLAKLAKVIDMKLDNETIIFYINVDDSLYSKIIKGTYKYWMQTGKTMTGKDLDIKEIKQWEEFSVLYSKVFTRVKFNSNRVFKYKDVKYNRSGVKVGAKIYEELRSLIKTAKKAKEENMLNSLNI